MAAISELISTKADGTISFENTYTFKIKAKFNNYEFHGDMYKVKTCQDTKFERNGLFVYESVPGTAVTNLKQDQRYPLVEGPEDAQITLELAEETEYEITIDGKSAEP